MPWLVRATLPAVCCCSLSKLNSRQRVCAAYLFLLSSGQLEMHPIGSDKIVKRWIKWGWVGEFSKRALGLA